MDPGRCYGIGGDSPGVRDHLRLGCTEVRPALQGLPWVYSRRRGRGFCGPLRASLHVLPGRLPAGAFRAAGHRLDHPDADRNLMLRVSQLTTVPIRTNSGGNPEHIVVELTDDELFQCPFIFMSDVGTIGINPDEAERLRQYLLRGGFLWVDDFWGSRAWRSWVREFQKVLPEDEYPIEDVQPGSTIFNALYVVYDVPQVPSIQHWRRSGRGSSTSEQGSDSAVPHLRSIRDEQGRVMVLMSHNTDIADGWEREGEDVEFFYLFSPKAYALGINIVLYALTH